MKKTNICALLVALMMLLTGVAGAEAAENLEVDWYSMGYAAYDLQNYEEAITWWEPYTAEMTDPVLLYQLGWMYQYGLAEADEAHAYDAYLRAAEMGNADALLAIAYMYTTGNTVVPQSDELAYTYVAAAADAGLPGAYQLLGQMYTFGNTYVAQDDVQALYWMSLAGQGGIADASYFVATCYEQGIGAEVDLEMAFAWYQAASELGHAYAFDRMGTMYIGGLGVAADEVLGVNCYQAAADLGCPDAFYHLGVSCEMGLCMEQPDLEMALVWYMNAMDAGYVVPENENTEPLDMTIARISEEIEARKFDPDWLEKANAAYELGDMPSALFFYEMGAAHDDLIGLENAAWMCYGVPEVMDGALAFGYASRAAELGSGFAYGLLGSCYLQGVGTLQSDVDAFISYTHAIDLGDTNSYYNLAYCYEVGLGTDVNLEQAYYWYTLGVEAGNANACYRLGLMNYYGIYVEYNLETAYTLFCQGAELGSADCFCVLGEMYEYGYYVAIDYSAALEYYRYAMDSGVPYCPNGSSTIEECVARVEGYVAAGY